MKSLWMIRGKLAGTYQQMSDTEAQPLLDAGDAQIVDGNTPLAYPENHPHYEGKRKPRKKTTARKKYPNKMMSTDTEV